MTRLDRNVMIKTLGGQGLTGRDPNTQSLCLCNGMLCRELIAQILHGLLQHLGFSRLVQVGKIVQVL